MTNELTNFKEIISLSKNYWNEAEKRKITSINASSFGINQYTDQYNRNFDHFCTTSYLGLEYNKKIITGAINGINEAGILRIPNSRNRSKLDLLAKYEYELSTLFNCNALSTLSCSAASSEVLPLLSAGIFTDNNPPIIVYDKFAHHSMYHIKPSYAAETEVIIMAHNDMNALEDICKKHSNVAYIADGAYSMGGLSKIKDLIFLQNKYNLFLYIDDSHSLSILGKNGCGYARSHIPILNNKTIIVASLAKAFGASGGIIMLGNNLQKNLINCHGGPSNWSQNLNSAAIGAGLASIEIHKTDELVMLQNKLQENIALFDSFIETEERNNLIPIRLIKCHENDITNDVCEFLMNNGFLTSSVLFPVVPKGRSAIRVTLRADMPQSKIQLFCELIKNKLSEYKIN